jgi:hypothetical protein
MIAGLKFFAMSAVAIGVLVTTFVVWTWFSPWLMVFDTTDCAESPLGFYRLQIVPFELTAHEAARVQVGQSRGGFLELVGFYLGKFDPCVN